MATGAGAKPFKGTLDNTKMFGLLKTAFGTFYRRVDVVARAGATPAPWTKLQGYAQRKFADFLD